MNKMYHRMLCIKEGKKMAFWRCVDRDKQRHATEDDIVVFMNLNSPTNVLIFCSAVPPPLQGKIKHKSASILKDLVKLCKLMKILSIRYTCTEFLKFSQSKVALMFQ